MHTCEVITARIIDYLIELGLPVFLYFAEIAIGNTVLYVHADFLPPLSCCPAIIIVQFEKSHNRPALNETRLIQAAD